MTSWRTSSATSDAVARAGRILIAVCIGSQPRQIAAASLRLLAACLVVSTPAFAEVRLSIDHGRVTLPLERELRVAGGLQASRNDIVLYACGPEPMLEALAQIASRYRRRSQVSVERVMGCGLGGCYSCVIPVRNGSSGHHYVRSCIGGPVFEGADIVWD